MQRLKHQLILSSTFMRCCLKYTHKTMAREQLFVYILHIPIKGKRKMTVVSRQCPPVAVAVVISYEGKTGKLANESRHH